MILLLLESRGTGAEEDDLEARQGIQLKCQSSEIFNMRYDRLTTMLTARFRRHSAAISIQYALLVLFLLRVVQQNSGDEREERRKRQGLGTKRQEQKMGGKK